MVTLGDVAESFCRHGCPRSLMKILACNSNRPLAEAMSRYLDLPLTKASVRRFPWKR